MAALATSAREDAPHYSIDAGAELALPVGRSPWFPLAAPVAGKATDHEH